MRAIQIATPPSKGCGCSSCSTSLGELSMPTLADVTEKLKAIDMRTWLLVGLAASAAAYLLMREFGEVRRDRRRRRG